MLPREGSIGANAKQCCITKLDVILNALQRLEGSYNAHDGTLSSPPGKSAIIIHSPTLQEMSKSLVFITGGTGFIGAEVIPQALEAGYRVRLSIRKPEQQALVEKRYPEYVSDIETVVIPDISEREPFETALKDVDYVIHLASPVPGKGVDLKEDFIKPALNGTEAILYAALKFPRIKTIVITSSCVALLPIDVPLAVDKFIKGTRNSHLLSEPTNNP